MVNKLDLHFLKRLLIYSDLNEMTYRSFECGFEQRHLGTRLPTTKRAFVNEKQLVIPSSHKTGLRPRLQKYVP